MAVGVQTNIPLYDSKSDVPLLFNGTTRLFIGLTCPFAQRVWIARNYKGLDNMELHAIDLRDKPSWYKEKVYSAGMVPALEYNGEVKGESLDLLEFLNKNFEGPSIYSTDPKVKESEDALLQYVNTFTKLGFGTLRMTEPTKATIDESAGPAFDYLEAALGKHSDEGPFLVGHLGVVDFTYIPFVDRFKLTFLDFFNYDILDSRPKLAKWIEEMDKVEAYAKTKPDSKTIIENYKRMFGKA